MMDAIQALYQRVAAAGRSVQELSDALKPLQKGVNDQVASLTEEIKDLTAQVKREGELHIKTLEAIGKSITREIKRIREGIGLEALIQMKDAMKKILDATKGALTVENVKFLMDEAEEAVRILVGEKLGDEGEEEEKTEKGETPEGTETASAGSASSPPPGGAPPP